MSRVPLASAERFLRRILGRTAPQPEQVRPPELPSDEEKHATVREYARRFGCRLLVETGTFQGGTVAALRDDFQRIWSIELNPQLAARARDRFVDAPHVTILAGDSNIELPQLLSSLDGPTLFWLDAHYSKGVPSALSDQGDPLERELRAVLDLAEPRHVILIDDARYCGVLEGWPSIAEIEHIVAESRLPLEVELRRDIVRISLAEQAGPDIDRTKLR